MTRKVKSGHGLQIRASGVKLEFIQFFDQDGKKSFKLEPIPDGDSPVRYKFVE